METGEILQALLSLIFVISLIGLSAFVLKYFFVERNFAFKGASTRRLKILEHLALDNRRRIMIIEKDGKEEITILLGASVETIISTVAVKGKK
jgi:flagellar biogenesis protein FliO